MEALDQKLKVAPTAAIVLHCARSLFESGPAKTFADKIDVSGALPVIARMETFWPTFADTILYRKKFVRHLLREYLSDGNPVQVCLLGAGLDPLSLWLLEQFPGQISGIFEVDQEHVDLKKQLYPASDRIHFIQADITDTLHLPDRLRGAGYHPDVPTIVILEGLIYYIGDSNFLNIMQFFRTANKTNVAILDYIPPDTHMPPAVRELFKPLHQVIASVIGGSLQRYSREQVFDMVAALQGDVVQVASMQDVEYRLNGRNEIYYGEGEGFIELLSCYI